MKVSSAYIWAIIPYIFWLSTWFLASALFEISNKYICMHVCMYVCMCASGFSPAAWVLNFLTDEANTGN